jgi:septal ring factor EnvC (AmiA/AmiB activator)
LWLRFLKEIEGYYEKLPEEFESNEFIYSAIQICERSSFSPKELFAYDHAETQAIWDNSIRGLEDEVVESRKNLAEKDKTLAEKDKTLAEKDKTLAEKDKTLAEKDKTLAEKDREIEELKKQLKNP